MCNSCEGVRCNHRTTPLPGELAQEERMSRTTVQRWRARFVADGCDGLEQRPRRGRPRVLTQTTRALLVALACQRAAHRNLPLSRYSLSELASEAQ
jgi:transposase